MDDDAGMIPSSPSAETSSSSSDIDTESTCSFFRDRSTTLGTLMGVSLAADWEDGPQPEPTRDAAAAEEENMERARAPAEEDERWRWRRRRWRRPRGASWWRLCRDDGGGATPLAHFLDMERREATAPLFEQRRRAPPSSSSSTPTPTAASVGEERGIGRLKLRRSVVQGTSSSSLARLPVLLTGICSGGA
ncbi:uncharacterized protein At3g17950 [Brachypodium distachyon]|uniref:Uncharacterized protein n=1 Tax=Brachypodium distachyon TaxID=15368 RepID=A0A0Q3JT22_BRADI|nr:uncharacterized protein At3g17950 [Brachypodium distachyon]KQK01585.1 hypothetical protein BRADI_3g56861v3 [Brachypodium distachyon]|eukprot:XP_014756195.1 uncharacterized protein At3g17950 [Brachypodium distachyon]